MTQDGFAGALGMSREAINKMEANKAPIERRTELAARYLLEHPEEVVDAS